MDFSKSNDSGGSCCGTWWIEPVHLYSALGSVFVFLNFWIQLFVFIYKKKNMPSIKLTFSKMSGNLLCWFCLCHPHAANRRRCAERSIWNLEGFFFFFFIMFFSGRSFSTFKETEIKHLSQITWHIRKKKYLKNRKRCILFNSWST